LQTLSHATNTKESLQRQRKADKPSHAQTGKSIEP
jgi:hypothetical protein